ncbi:MAG: nickel pincer cofactor biosynthesis protein LarC, partial [Acidimicrobiaceae bacterium]|nr:nickel pincer cofactor biosynthesis protein LarC [Acidimicrobiaceae bacterium]
MNASPDKGPTLAWWHCFSGIAGDMALASLVDAGADLDTVVEQLRRLPVPGWTIEAEAVTRGGVAATHLDVRVSDTTAVRHHADIVNIIEGADLPARARTRALATFARLADVEGRLHRVPPDEVHFHEVGGIDAILDVVGTCLALESLGVDEVRSSPIAQGMGMVRSAHGPLPNPAPATVELLRGAPTYGTDVALELTTPTGAALVSTLAAGFGPLPAMEIRASGFGAGTRDLDGRPNALQVVIGAASSSGEERGGQEVVLIEANLDDATGEILAHTVARLLEAGAHDAWLTPVLGKKGRPAHVVSVLADPVLAGRLRELLLAESGSIGSRSQTMVRWPAARRTVSVEVDGHPVGVKVTAGRIKAEFDDTARVGALLGIPAREVARRAEEAAHLGL